jgi:hypothetical protein
MKNHRESRGHSERPAAPESLGAEPDREGLVPPLEPAASLPTLAEEDDPPPSLTPHIDAHGFDPADYKWIPVRRKPRKDGWSEAKQRLFIETLADTGCIRAAAGAVRMTVQSAYALRRAPGGEAFAAAWMAAIQQGALKLADVAFERALNGTEEPVYNRDGMMFGTRTRYSERLMMFLMRAHLPERYAHAHRAERPEGAPPAPQTAPMAEALARLQPAQPSEPHKLMPPEELDVEVESADILDGKLPQRFRAVPPDLPLMPLGEDFERGLEAAKLGYEFGPDGKLIKWEPSERS